MTLQERLLAILPDLEHGRETHNIWANCDQKYRDENPDIGDVEFHLAHVRIYDERISLVTEAASKIDSLEKLLSEVERERDEAHEDACFYKSCALSGEVPAEGSQPSAKKEKLRQQLNGGE